MLTWLDATVIMVTAMIIRNGMVMMAQAIIMNKRVIHTHTWNTTNWAALVERVGDEFYDRT